MDILDHRLLLKASDGHYKRFFLTRYSLLCKTLFNVLDIDHVRPALWTWRTEFRISNQIRLI